ncbi:hypothetical protein ACO0LC_20130 [Undibacterium sp. JH2W]|uniref:hypothetical protein n=1 Tax=Undibacterium sp. JH2W TaxID=3413037 RepID=UPI003BF14DDD
MKPINPFSWLIHIALDPQAIRFVLFGKWTFKSLKVEDIKSVVEINQESATQNAGGTSKPLLARSFLIETRLGWSERKMLVTPKDPDEFLAWVKLKKIDIHSKA